MAEEVHPMDNLESKSVVILLINGGCGSAQPTVGGATPGLLVFGAIRNQAEEAMMSKAVRSTHSWFLLQFLPFLSSCSNFPR